MYSAAGVSSLELFNAALGLGVLLSVFDYEGPLIDTCQKPIWSAAATVMVQIGHVFWVSVGLIGDDQSQMHTIDKTEGCSFLDGRRSLVGKGHVGLSVLPFDEAVQEFVYQDQRLDVVPRVRGLACCYDEHCPVLSDSIWLEVVCDVLRTVGIQMSPCR
ncbi:uncharacterized protein BKA55DRAFT_537710 [Fusarium redolens]|uniref:Uncharacterized protein n=1 Tax=Fusarium redolens TaxID=48865 RepID=A0A9P9KAG2_FUSRE|nr:uncharacterized protein BKA55DRAFT_537710 [Fusarium redolens]KAH7255297.1 hypothetical protein BKA55DRAFT_537710 [Fusarium redolens]